MMRHSLLHGRWSHVITIELLKVAVVILRHEYSDILKLYGSSLAKLFRRHDLFVLPRTEMICHFPAVLNAPQMLVTLEQG